MGRRPKWGRSVDGVLLLNKDTGMTSNDALQKTKHLFFANKAGHTGSLDPLATGVLPICFGEATKFSQYLLGADKKYTSTFRLGITTETGDCDGKVVAVNDASHISEDMLANAIVPFRGEISQVPSMYSALKHQGKPLYKWAREGIEVPREPRQVTIFEYEIIAYRDIGTAHPEMDVEVFCSKGTYIRSLAEDLGASLGVGAHVSRLHRTMAGPFEENESLSLQDLAERRGEMQAEVLDSVLLPTDSPVSALPMVSVSDDMGDYFRQGQAVMSTEAYRFAQEGGMVRIYLESGKFLGVAELIEGQLAPKRVVVSR